MTITIGFMPASPEEPIAPVLRNNFILMTLDVMSLSSDNTRGGKRRLQNGVMTMTRFLCLFHSIAQLVYTLLAFLVDGMRYLGLCLRSPAALAAENLFLRKQLALYQERGVKPKRVTAATRLALVWLARWFDWQRALIIVQPQTLTRWHRQGFRLFWRWKSNAGRPPLPVDLRALIRRMARDNPSWGQERIANELLLKLGLRVSPRTVRKYLPTCLHRGGPL
jgi:hypothetical protein